MTENHDKNEQHDVSLYEKMVARTAELLEDGRKSLDEALKKAKEDLGKAGDFSTEQMDKVADYVKRDVVDNAGKATEAVKKAVDPQRVAAGVHSIYARILNSAADALSDLAAKAEKATEFKTGEITSSGTLTCKECGAEMHMKATGRIPPCPKCKKTIFRRSY